MVSDFPPAILSNSPTTTATDDSGPSNPDGGVSLNDHVEPFRSLSQSSKFDDNHIAGGVNPVGNSRLSSVISGVDTDILPPRLFSTDRYPVKGRINSYSKPEYLLDIVEILDGYDEFKWLKESCFGRLFELPVRKSSLSGKLVHQFLCRSLVTKRKQELWFVFGGHPIRFSLREFGIVTGLNCGQFPSQETLDKLQNPAEGEEHYHHSLIGPKKSYSIQSIVNMLKLDKRLPKAKRMDGDRRLRLALIVIVEGILVCESSNVRASMRVAEMVKDLDSFVKYPWGRLSFLKTLEMVKVGDKVESVSKLVDKLNQSHTATHGFTLAFQLLILHAIPLLEQYLPDWSDEQTFTDRSVLHLTKLKTFHNANILRTEQHEDLDVENILNGDDEADIQDYSWGEDEMHDVGVEYMCKKLKDGHIFRKEDWHGGVAHLPLLTAMDPLENTKKTVVKEKKRVPKPKPMVKVKAQSLPKPKPTVLGGEGNESHVDRVTAASLLEEVDRRINEHTSKIQLMLSVERAGMRDEIVDDVLKTLREKGVYDRSIKHSDLMEQINKSSWSVGASGSTQPTGGGPNKDWSGFMPGIPEILKKININEDDQPRSDDILTTMKTSGEEEDESGSESKGDEEDSGSESDGEVDLRNDVVVVGSESEDCSDQDGDDGDNVRDDDGEDEGKEELDDDNDEREEDDGKDEEEVDDQEEEEVDDQEEEEVDDQEEEEVDDQEEKEVDDQEEERVDDHREEEEDGFDNLSVHYDGGLQIVEYVDRGIVDGEKFLQAEVSSTFHTNKRCRQAADDDQTPFPPIPTKRLRTKPRRFGQCSSSAKKRKALETESEVQLYMPFRPVSTSLRTKFLTKLESYRKK